MVMGPTHAMSSAALWLGAAATTSATFAAFQTDSMPVLVMSTLVASGAALAPDIDSHSSTVVNSFGVAGKVTHKGVNSVSVAVRNLTATRYDGVVSNGHRTLFHTTLMAVLVGLGVSALASIPMVVEVFGKDFTLGQIFSLTIMGIFTHLAIGGLFAKEAKKTRKKYGVLGGLISSAAITAAVAFTLPAGDTYGWLGLAVGVGWFAHLLGDAITKLGVPMAFPLKIKGKRWYDVRLPPFMTIRAGGAFEKAVLLPVCTIAVVVLFAMHATGNIPQIDLPEINIPFLS